MRYNLFYIQYIDSELSNKKRIIFSVLLRWRTSQNVGTLTQKINQK